MKVVFVGGGAHRYLNVARSILAEPAVMDNGEINVYDLNVERAEVMGKMIQKTPEFADINCKVSWGTTLDEALENADVVCVVIMAGNPKNFSKSCLACNQYGFIGSDQLSPSGAFLAMKGGPILLDIAKRMEELCPDAWLLDFANPVAVISAAVNNHTKIKCLGVCAGYTNHLWDLSRLIGKDEQAEDCDVNSAGVNHMSFITGGTMNGEDIYELLKKHITDDWQEPKLSPRWNEFAVKNIQNSMQTLVKLYRKYGYMIFSSEGDGLAHLDMEGHYFKNAANSTPKTDSEIDRDLEKNYAVRQKGNELFASFLDQDLSKEDWNLERPESLYLLRGDQNIMVKIIKALAGVYELKIATSYLNNGAVTGFTDRTVLEYSQILSKDGIKSVEGLAVPDVFYGLTSALASHQTLLGDAIATEDPKILFDALYSYPVKQDTKDQKELWKALLEINKEELPESFQLTKKYLDL